MGGGWREAAAEVFVQEQVHTVALDKDKAYYWVVHGGEVKILKYSSLTSVKNKTDQLKRQNKKEKAN